MSAEANLERYEDEGGQDAKWAEVLEVYNNNAFYLLSNWVVSNREEKRRKGRRDILITATNSNPNNWSPVRRWLHIEWLLSILQSLLFDWYDIEHIKLRLTQFLGFECHVLYTMAKAEQERRRSSWLQMHLNSVSRREVRVMKEVGIEFRSPWMNIIVVGGGCLSV